MSKHPFDPLKNHNPGLTTIKVKQTADLKPDPKNARIHKDRQIELLAKSIQAFGFNVPVLIDNDNNVIAGHGRLLACHKLGITEVPTIALGNLSKAQLKAFMIADNRLTEIASWDDQLLGGSLKELSLLDLDFQLDATGFEMAEIDLRIDQFDLDANGQEEDIPQSLPEGPAVSVLGDLWQLGAHRLLCGNALLIEDYQRLLGQHKAHIVFADAPYNVAVDGHVTNNGRVQHREFAMASGEMTSVEFTNFLERTFVNLIAFSTDGSIHYLCMDWRHLSEILSAGSVYTELKNLCVWAKDNAGMGSLYRSQHELVLVYKSGKAKHVNNVQLGQYGRYRSNVWNYPGVNSFGRSTDEGNLLALHPTVKPVAMIADALYDCSNRGDIVLDPFLGSGSTLIAAERTGRLCYGIELDPLYVDTAIRRWQKQTGLKAIHAVSGLSFDQTSEQEVIHG
jgi:DNA modification methylase